MNRNRSLQLYIKEHLSLYVFVGIIFIIGVVFGAVMVNALSLEQKQEMMRYLSNFFSSVEQGDFTDVRQSFEQSFALHIKWILIIWILGMSVIGLPLILILDFLKGVLVGFSVGYLVGQLSWKGLLFALVSVAPQNIVIIPALIVCSVTAMAFSIHMVKHRFMMRKGSFYEPFMRYSATILLSGALLAGVAMFEAYVSPVMMKWVTPMLMTMSP
ncbi:stage II sporulation protein M [Paenibacillus doosanensis]|uniref:Stage II sporulation protein M n=1 Tax=Paenibacillus konkukensis TaxID=2020716 RepID=A0ABY4RIT8_9BACL|nr:MULTISPECIES: stage II sporulation protein M [Paenibacillus]MCS7461596.1 stage II sporulation protein M [Paenibacillus doosanensis]UQZ82020.1 Stage II sporulation protein M [Paenibacillus konkukensis]